MRKRKTSRRIVFHHPFSLDGLDGLLPAGTYSVETEHERGWWRVFGQPRQSASRIRICTAYGLNGLLDTVVVDHAALSRAQRTDSSDLQPPRSELPQRSSNRG